MSGGETKMDASSYPYKVSVVVPIYNVEAYLEECLDSIAEQSLDSVEAVLVDDGSMDGSSAIARAYADNYPNFVYYLKENGGLGDARNYGMDRARGEYICFCDSDDTLPHYACEHMYDLAKKYDCDIVSGDMQRFSVGKTSVSSLHRIAFQDVCEQMSVHTHPELLYDSTTPNKLFRLSFVKDTGLRFPKGMYYEDIPFNLPIQCVANKVGHLDEVVYNWRSREGGESITQSRTVWKNFSDRLKALRMVDAFFAEHVTDDVVLLEKDVKSLRIDLRIYIDVLLQATEEFQQSFMREVVPYVRGIRNDAFDKLSAVDRIKYYFILEDDLQGLLDYLDYAKGIMRSIPVHAKGGRYYGAFATKVPLSYKDMTYEIQHRGCAVNVREATLNEETGLTVSGDIFYRVLDAAAWDRISVQGFVESQADGGSVYVAEASIGRAEKPGIDHKHSIKHRFIRNLQRVKTAYSVKVAWKDIETLEDGVYKIRLNYTRNGFESDRVMVAWPVRGPEPWPRHIIKNGRLYAIAYSPGSQLQIKIEPAPDDVVTDVVLQDGVCRLLDGDRVVNEFQLEMDDIQSLGDLARTVNRLRYETTIDDFSILATKNAMLRVLTTSAGILQLRALPMGALCASVMENGTLFDFNVKEYSPGQLDGYNEAEFVGRRYGVRIPCCDYVVSDDGTAICRIDVENEEVVKNMRPDSYDLTLRHDSQNEMAHPPLKVYGKPRTEVVTTELKKHGYRYSLTMNGVEGVAVSKIWGFFERTAHKRSVMRNRIYHPLYRIARHVLPMDKKMVLFESYWGTQSGCNPGGLYRYISQNHPDYHCVWSLVDERMPVGGDAIRVRKGSLAYYLTMARTHYLVNNVNYESWFEKRKGQIEIQTTHGTPLKTVGFAAEGEFKTPEALEAFAARCARWDYLVSPGPRTTEILADNYHFDRQFLETGFPRNDVLFERNNEEEIARLKATYGFPLDKKIVLYAPTWRITNKFNLNLDLTAMANALGDDWIIGLRPHHYSLAGVKWGMIDPRVRDMSTGLSIEDCYLMADVLITDYSSVMFDYALLGKPMIFFVYDLENYRDTLRGFNFDFEAEAPGPLCKTSEEVIDALVHLDDTVRTYESAYKAFKNGFGGFEDGTAGKRIFGIVFK